MNIETQTIDSFFKKNNNFFSNNKQKKHHGHKILYPAYKLKNKFTFESFMNDSELSLVESKRINQ
jgi:hypothetical protein